MFDISYSPCSTDEQERLDRVPFTGVGDELAEFIFRKENIFNVNPYTAVWMCV